MVTLVGRGKYVPSRRNRRVPASETGMIGAPLATAALKAPSWNGRTPSSAVNVPSGKIKSVDEKAAKFTITLKDGKDKTFAVDDKTEFWGPLGGDRGTGPKGLKDDCMEKGYEITVDDLKGALAKEGVSLREGDALIVHTGWGSHWKTDNALFNSGAPGIGLAAGRWLVEQKIVLVSSDTGGVEVAPNPEHPGDEAIVHQLLLTRNGIYILENLDTSELARDKVYEFAFVFSPLKLKGATGSPGNPLAVR